MKKLVTVQEIEGQGLEALLGEQVTFFCLNYIYHGKLTGVNVTDILLQDAYIVYETGSFQDNGFKDAQYVSKELRLRTSTIESYGVLDNKKKSK
jgi:hypothetical protein